MEDNTQPNDFIYINLTIPDSPCHDPQCENCEQLREKMRGNMKVIAKQKQIIDDLRKQVAYLQKVNEETYADLVAALNTHNIDMSTPFVESK